MPPLIVIPVVLLVGGTAGHLWGKFASRRESSMDSNLREVFNRALVGKPLPPDKLKALCVQLKKAGHKHECAQLMQRYNLQKVPPEIQEKRRLAVKQALKSTDKTKVLELAAVFEKQGAFSTANCLKNYAEGL